VKADHGSSLALPCQNFVTSISWLKILSSVKGNSPLIQIRSNFSTNERARASFPAMISHQQLKTKWTTDFTDKAG
jgi:hypothetical protein